MDGLRVDVVRSTGNLSSINKKLKLNKTYSIYSM